MEIKLSGFGGQGIIRMGIILGRAAAIFAGKNATLTQSFGPEARGGACSAQLIVSDELILYPYLTSPEILVSMSQEAYTKFEPGLTEDGILLVDEDLVHTHVPRGQIRQYAIPATRFAEQMGNRLFANVIMTGFLTAITGAISAEAVKEALPGSVPERLVEKNIEAFQRGFDYGKELLAQGRPTKHEGKEKAPAR